MVQLDSNASRGIFRILGKKMPSIIPILAIPVAAIILSGGGKRKKSRSRTSGHHSPPPYSPPSLSTSQKSSGSGYSNVSRKRMQQIQVGLLELGYDVGPDGVDGIYGKNTKRAVMEFQKDYGLKVDGKPGPNTQARIDKALSEGGGPSRGDECDPLNPSTWGEGNICSMVDGRWVRVKASSGQPAVSKDLTLNGLNEVVFNDFLSDFRVGSNWRYQTLDAWLNQRRKSGWLATKRGGASKFKDAYPEWRSKDWWAAMEGAMFSAATPWLIKETAKSWALMAAGTAIGTVSTGPLIALSAVLWTDVLLDKIGNMISERHFELQKATAALALKDFIASHDVVIQTADGERIPLKINTLRDPDSERTSEAVAEFFKIITGYISRFQSSEYPNEVP